jgi:hypothetical protein
MTITGTHSLVVTYLQIDPRQFFWRASVTPFDAPIKCASSGLRVPTYDADIVLRRDAKDGIGHGGCLIFSECLQFERVRST